MELETTAIGLAALASFAIPLLVLSQNRNKKEKELLKGMRALAAAHQTTLSAQDAGPDFAIGLSAGRDRLFYYKKRKERLVEYDVAVAGLCRCAVDTVKRSVKTLSGSDTLIDRVDLVLHPAAKNQEPIRLEFFNADELFQVNGELQLAKKWEAAVTACLPK